MFDAMVNNKIDTEGLEFSVVMDDVESLNIRALQNNDNSLQISKVSFHTYLYIKNNYQLLDSGSALGRGCGPLLITKEAIEKNNFAANSKVAIPGKYTTANMLFSIAFPACKNKVEMLFSEIENAVISGVVDAGVIIHENRFTYQQKGLHKVIDLGEYWEQTTNCAIPLGGIVASNKIEKNTIEKINNVLHKSIEYAFANPDSSKEYVKKYAQEIDDKVIKSHIDLYVNDFSIQLGVEGKKAIEMLEKKFNEGL